MRRGSASARGYGGRWQKARLTHLAREPLCRLCLAMGRTTPATVVDHIIPHRGDPVLFWDSSNWQSLCATCHSAVKQAEERRSGLRGCDADGNPLDPRHRWNQAGATTAGGGGPGDPATFAGRGEGGPNPWGPADC